MVKMTLNADIKKGKINKNIYGHFAEHLGRCIYEGFWVGKDSPIPNTDGIRDDVVEALKKVKIPVLRWPGDVLPMNITGWTALALMRSAPKPLIPTGVEWWRTTTLGPMSFSGCANCWVQMRI